MNIQEPHTTEMLKEMCKRVGQDYDKFDFKDSQWFMKNEWTQEEQDNFQEWLAGKLVEWKYVTKKGHGKYTPTYEAMKIVCNYGWKTKRQV